MTERERLAELIAEARLKATGTAESMNNYDEQIADYLIEHGACYIPYKRYQEIWVINNGYIHRCIVRDIVPYAMGRHLVRLDDTTDGCELDVELDILGEYSYPTYEEASDALIQKLKGVFENHDGI